jgi:hypothetical protein
MTAQTILPANSVSDTGIVSNSLRFNDGDSPALTRSLGTASSTQKGTFSFWVKRGQLTTAQMIYSNEVADDNNRGFIQFEDDDTLRIVDSVGGSNQILYKTATLFRDVGSWYHIVISFDTTAAGGARIKVYKNGTRIPDAQFGTSTEPNQNANLKLLTGGQTNKNHISKVHGGSGHFDGYLSEFVFCDGQVLDADDFGEFDSDSPTHWKPKDIKAASLTYGNMGFYLDFENSAALGNSAINSNHFGTVTNLAATDQSTDTCINNFATLNPLDVTLPSTFVLSEGNLDVLLNGFSNTGGNHYPRAFSTIQVASGKWYAECKITEEGNTATIGVSARTAVGLIDLSGTDYDWFGSNAHDYRYYHDGTKMNNNSSSNYGTTWDGGDTIGIALDMDNLAVYFSLNGTFQASGDPTSGASRTNAAFNLTAVDSTPNGAYKFGLGAQGDGNDNQGVWNFGSPPYAISSGNSDANGHGNFEYAVPSGYFALCTKNLAEYG